jgi:hypothetical protein
MDREFEVDVICRQRFLYRVRAPDAVTAERVASRRWQNGDPSDTPGVDSCELTYARATEALDRVRQNQDDEVVLRFIREREDLLMRLGGASAIASANDAISAAQAAADLGWSRFDPSGTPTVDIARAAQSLERLCAKRRLVCFERSRVRSGERGEIRLYCTPDYLERLSVTIASAPGPLAR